MKAAVWGVVVAMAMILGVRATAAGQQAPADLSATPALAEAEQKIRTEQRPIACLRVTRARHVRLLHRERPDDFEQTRDHEQNPGHYRSLGTVPLFPFGGDCPHSRGTVPTSSLYMIVVGSSAAVVDPRAKRGITPTTT